MLGIIAAILVGAGGVVAQSELAPACRVELVPEEVRGGVAHTTMTVAVRGRTLVLDGVDGEAAALRVFPNDSESVFAAYVDVSAGLRGGATLWRVPCSAGPATPFIHVQGADFGHAVLSPQDRVLFFSGPDGVFALDLTSRATRRLTRAVSPDCAKDEIPARDVVTERSWNPKALSFSRGCWYEFTWRGSEMQLLKPASKRPKVAPAPPPVTAIAVGAQKEIWLSDGRCAVPATFGRVLLSSDGGAHWRTVVVPMFVPQPVRFIIADRAKPGGVLLWTASCGSAAHADPGWIYVTTDAGKSFRPVASPPGIRADDNGRPASEQDPIYAVSAADGNLSELILYGESRNITGNMTGRWASHDAGRTWKELSPVTSAPTTVQANSLSVPEWDLTIREGGLYRSAGGRAAVKVYPPK